TDSLCRNICERSEVPFRSFEYLAKLTDADKEQWIRRLYGTGLNLISFWNSMNLIFTLYLKDNGIADPLVFSGQNMDSLYYIDTFAPSFYAIGDRYNQKLQD